MTNQTSQPNQPNRSTANRSSLSSAELNRPSYLHEQSPSGAWVVRDLNTGDLLLGEYETEAYAERMARRLTANIHLSDASLRALRTLASTKRLTLHQLAEQAKARVCPFDATDDGRKVLEKLSAHGLARLAHHPGSPEDHHGDLNDERINGQPTAVITQWGLDWLGRGQDSER